MTNIFHAGKPTAGRSFLYKLILFCAGQDSSNKVRFARVLHPNFLQRHPLLQLLHSFVVHKTFIWFCFFLKLVFLVPLFQGQNRTEGERFQENLRFVSQYPCFFHRFWSRYSPRVLVSEAVQISSEATGCLIMTN